MSENIAAGGTGNESANTGGAGVGQGGAGATGGQNQNTGTPPASGAGDKGSVPTWRDSLPETIRGDASIGRLNSVEDLAKSYIHAQSLVGKDKIVLPTEKSSDEDWNNLYAKIGRPESADKYGLKIEALGEAGNKELAEVAFKSGLSPKQLNNLVEWSDKNNKAQMEAYKANQNVERQKAREEMIKKAGGPDKFQIQFDKAAEALKLTADSEFIKFLSDSGLGEDPRVISYFSNLSKRMEEDGIKGHGGTSLGVQIQDVDKKISEIMSHPAYMMRDHAEHQSKMMEYRDLLGLKVSLRNKV